MSGHKEAPRASELTSIGFLITKELGKPLKEVKQMTAETAEAIEQMDDCTNAGATSHRMTQWHDIDWYRAQQNVKRLQARIVKATQDGKWGKVKALQRLLTHSFSGKVLAVKRVTENQGKNTPGVDRIIWDTPQKKMNGMYSLRQRDYHPQPLRRIYIPKKTGKMRPLSIPCMRCRSMQALYLLALSPVAEVVGDRNSYGFRPERSPADAIGQCYIALCKQDRAQWILEGDIKACFDKISHDWLLAHIPMEKTMLRKWLKAGFMDKHTLYPTDEGTPQGGIASPVIANLTLDGLEKLLKDRFLKPNNGHNAKVNFVRFANDFIVTGESKELLEKEVKPLVEQFLKERGLELSPEKTVITHIEEGFDFLGQNVRKYNGKMLIRPSKKNVTAFLDKVRTILKDNKQATAGRLIVQLIPVIQGWARYHQHIASKKAFKKVDHLIFCMLWRWAKRRHPKKGAKWVKNKYFHSRGNRNWVFFGEITDNKGTHQVQLPLAYHIRINRHVKVREMANPYDPEWETYFEKRLDLKMENNLNHRKKLLHLCKEQRGLCPICHQKITKITGWHSHHLIWRSKGGSDKMDNRVLLHPNCHNQVHSQGIPVVKPRSVKRAERDPALQGTTLFALLYERHPGRYQPIQVRTLQRHIAQWKALHGPEQDVIFEQRHRPGERGQSDFTHMEDLGVTLAGAPFSHMVYHFVLTYSNVEAVTICFSESFQALAEGLERCLWQVGGEREEWTTRYKALMTHYGMQPTWNNTGIAHENGDVEQSHYRFKEAVDQALRVRGSREFVDRRAYEAFLQNLVAKRNQSRAVRFAQEKEALRPLPTAKLALCKEVRTTVSRFSTIAVLGNTYSVPSRLIGTSVLVRVRAETLEGYVGTMRTFTLPRLLGKQQHRIDYHHLIWSLVRKPGAFAAYRYRDELFPTTLFRQAYDRLVSGRATRADHEYVRILHLAASTCEADVETALTLLLEAESLPTFDAVRDLVCVREIAAIPAIQAPTLDLTPYDQLIPSR